MNILGGSHIPMLVKLMGITDGPVLELGAGYYSTPLLYYLCKDNERKFVSYESDKRWSEKMGAVTTFIEDWAKADIDSTHWSVVLIDHRPAHRRYVDALRLKDTADYIVLHDSEAEADRVYGYSGIYKHFKYKYDYTKFSAHTTVISNFCNLEKFK